MTYTRDEINKHINSLPPDSKTEMMLRQLVGECDDLKAENEELQERITELYEMAAGGRISNE